ncbi:MAG: UDP-N-acetylmuramoyl-L-alanine--D-glutamate ligase [Sandaracinaceae bacterium]|nr:UDP-N-acetylmuramoyl-L-alanine--D-glutamate ligase [Sandaracinaceae bacterium]
MKNLDLKGKKVLVVGLGKSGLASLRLLSRSGAQLIANDMRPQEEIADAVREAKTLGVELVLGAHPEELFTSVDQIVLSPGVPLLPALVAADKKGIRIASEVEIASWFIEGMILGVTGTNGKSTVTSLLGEMMQKTGAPTFVGGNLGTPLVEAIGTDAARKSGVVVAEMSSFQLERVEHLHVHVAVLMNVTDDHLDRHGTFASYAAAKARIFHGQTKADFAIVPEGDEVVLALAKAGAAPIHTFGGSRSEVRVEGENIVDTKTGLSVPLADLHIRGAHNQMNACAAALAARLAGASVHHIESVLREFRGLPHRMELVRTRAGVSFFDDSKATNVGATVAAIDGIKSTYSHIVLIAGGKDKGGSYAPIAERMARVGRAVVLLGEATPLIESALKDSGVAIRKVASMEDAVARAVELAKSGDAVLLAPACASFDMYRSYAHRGDEFQRAVRALPEVA